MVYLLPEARGTLKFYYLYIRKLTRPVVQLAEQGREVGLSAQHPNPKVQMNGDPAGFPACGQAHG